MKKIIRILFLFSFLLGSYNTFSQKKNKNTLRIFVKDTANKPIAGAFIFIDNIKQKKTTNISGFIQVKLRKTPKKISALSSIYGLQDAVYNGKQNMIVKYSKDAISADVASTTEGVIVSKRTKRNNNVLYRNIYEYLRGRVAGVVVSSDNSILIRGAGSFQGSTAPLFIVNGVSVSSVEDIIPSDIKSVTVLKGPETAQYGVRGSNGVILIKTL
ncbi:TonB-dependent receptor plug domain-containing protein [Polaribacter sp. PL03]|uniref:TonB-dependent receptor plug domain-containing protein n=1 Tax=Polaribacter sp. PL03 TaxID=3088353 RepID=UPI0029CE3EE1|nr:TonB-dependent receptor plug domain-containing protein [Polaribacter sp. PL03]MDX6746591.1 TonB-dependent receptor plug domain-containing protein [Polaribacter sp. PL03]